MSIMNRAAIPCLFLGLLSASPGSIFAQPCFPNPSLNEGCGSCDLMKLCFDPASPSPTLECENIREKFAAIATWWDPATQQGQGAEKGIHLRWSFDFSDRNRLRFPEGGFEIQRRATGAHQFAWQVITPRIYPATNADPNDRDPTTIRSRVPPGVNPTLYQNDAKTLLSVLRCATTCDLDRTFWWFEPLPNELSCLKPLQLGDPCSDDRANITTWNVRFWDDSQVSKEPPTNSGEEAIVSEYDCYVDVFRELTGGVDPNGFQFNPMGLLQLAAAADPVIARIMGLYYVDVTARADVLYDYRVIAHYRSGPLCAMVSKVGAVTTQPLESPHPVLATPLTSEVNEETGCASTTRVGVELTWRFQLAEIYEKAGLTPEDSLGDYGIFPISYIVERATFQPGLTPDRHVYQRVTVGGPPVPVPQIFIGTERDPDA